MYVHKSCTFYLLCSLRGARARQLTTTTTTATIVLEIQIQKLQNVHSGTTNLLWVHGGMEMVAVYPIYCFIVLQFTGNQNATQSKCRINEGFPPTRFPRLDGAACWAEYAVKPSCFVCCCCCIVAASQKSWQLYWVEENNLLSNSNIFYCLLHSIISQKCHEKPWRII